MMTTITEKYEIRRLLSGAGFVVVDLTWQTAMVGPFRTRRRAQAWIDGADYCYDVARLVCHECDAPLGDDRNPVAVEWNDADGAHVGTCYTHVGRCRTDELTVTR